MTRLKQTLFLAAMALALSSQAQSECATPEAPIIPDGNVASQDELVAAQKAMKAYQATLIEHRECLAGMDAAVVPDSEEAEQQTASILAAYNASVDSEQAVAEQFNAAVRAFKAR